MSATGSKRIEALRAAKALARRQPWRLRGVNGRDWGFKKVVRDGKAIRVHDPGSRGLMVFCFERIEAGATYRQVCNKVEAGLAAIENRKPLAYGFQRFTRDMARTAVAAERRLRAQAEADRALLERMHAHENPVIL